MTAGLVMVAISLAIWLYLLTARGMFWRTHIRDDALDAQPLERQPSVAVIIPARNEASVIKQSLSSLLEPHGSDRFTVILVDDQSEDGTAVVAASTAELLEAEDRLKILRGEPLPPGWTGKLWAVKQGIDYANAMQPPPAYLLLTDADIAYSKGAVARLLAHAERNKLVLTSLMVKLRCHTLAERLLIPAFVFFFQMLYPFAWVNRRDRTVAAAAGGCMLIRRDALEAAGGIGSIRDSLIDDCAMGRRLKTVGPIWLGLTDSVFSLRPYDGFNDIRRMVARSAYDQLNYSPVLLLGTVLGMILTYLAPPAVALFADGMTQVIGIAGWAMMTLAFLPIIRFYRLSPLWAFALPLIAVLYTFFTIDSAYQHARGRGGYWKGRVQARRVAAR